MLTYLFLIFLNTSWILACNLVDTKLDFQLEGNGFHRILKTQINISSMARFINCKVSYFYQIPQGAFVDIDSLNSSLYGHCFVGSRFDIEEPYGSPKLKAQLQPIFFHSKNFLLKVFLFSDTLLFPIHLRYHKPNYGGDPSTNSIEFEPPRVYLKCESNETLLAEPTCRRRLEKIPCGCHRQPKCSYIRIDTSKITTLKTNLPVGNKEHSFMVVLTSLITISSCLIMILFSKEKKNIKNKSE